MPALLRHILWISLVIAMSAQAQTTQKQYQLQKSGDGTLKLTLVDAPVRQPGEHEVLVRVHAVSLNRRDIYMRAGQYPGGVKTNLVPLSDGAGEVVGAGAKATRFRKGARVAAIFFHCGSTAGPSPSTSPVRWVVAWTACCRSTSR